MDILINKGLLFLYGMMGLLLIDFRYSFVIACFLSLSISGLFYAFYDQKIQFFFHLLLLFYSVLIFFRPEFAFFLPLLIYDYWPEEWINSRRLTALSGKTLLLVICLFTAFLGIFFSCKVKLLFCYPYFGCILALLLRVRLQTYHNLAAQYRKTRDDDTELQILLKERNQTLLEKQNSEIYAATLRERNRIAREIHDNVGHMLTRAILMLGALRVLHKDDSLSETLDQLNTTLNQAMDNIRQSVHDLHDSSVNLKESLDNLIREYSFCPVKLNYEMSPDLPGELKYSIISISKEALVNISKHSNATSASITAIEHPGFYQFIIEDNGNAASGNGFSPSGTPNNTPENGIGLINMEHRVKALKGTMQIRTENGFCIHITVPRQ